MSKERKQLSKAIESLVSKQEAFAKAITALENFKKEALYDLDLEIENKKTDLDALTKQHDNAVIDGRIKVDQELKQYEYDAAVQILAKDNLVPVEKDEIDELKQQLTTLKETSEAQLKKEVAIERNKGDSALKAALETASLKHQAEHASLQAQVEQRTHEIEVMARTIKNLQVELAAQRELTKDVAMASKQGAIQQTFGKQ